MAEREGSKVEKMKKQYRLRQVNRAPALYNAGYVKHDNEVFLNGEAKKAHGKLNRIICLVSRVSRFTTCFKKNLSAIYYAANFKLKRIQVKVEKLHNY